MGMTKKEKDYLKRDQNSMVKLTVLKKLRKAIKKVSKTQTCIVHLVLAYNNRNETKGLLWANRRIEQIRTKLKKMTHILQKTGAQRKQVKELENECEQLKG